MRDRLFLSKRDALDFLQCGIPEWGDKTLIYLDPPYYKKGRDLYYDFYVHEDHEQVARFVKEKLGNLRWIVSYDNVPEIRALYKGSRHRTYGIGYSARVVGEGSEVMFFSNALHISPLVGAVR